MLYLVIELYKFSAMDKKTKKKLSKYAGELSAMLERIKFIEGDVEEMRQKVCKVPTSFLRLSKLPMNLMQLLKIRSMMPLAQ